MQLIIIAESTMQVENIEAPKIDPIASIVPLGPSPPADIEVTTSGAPFARASNVTPANNSENLNCFPSFVNDGVRYFSAYLKK